MGASGPSRACCCRRRRRGRPAAAAANTVHDGVLRVAGDPAEDAVQGDDVGVALAAPRGGLLEARLGKGEVLEPCRGDEAARMGHVLRVEVDALEGDVRIGGREDPEAEALAEAEFEETLRLQPPPRRAAGCEGGEGEMRGCGLAVEAGRVADIGDVAARPIHAPLPFVRTTIGRLPRRSRLPFAAHSSSAQNDGA